MIAISEDYVSFETAKLLKEKGFNEECWCYYHNSKIEHYFKKVTNKGWTTSGNISAPTLQMAMRWLREVHDILLFILPAQENGKLVYLVEVWTWNEEEGVYKSTYAPMPRKEPEQACEAAIKYCLENLI